MTTRLTTEERQAIRARCEAAFGSVPDMRALLSDLDETRELRDAFAVSAAQAWRLVQEQSEEFGRLRELLEDLRQRVRPGAEAAPWVVAALDAALSATRAAAEQAEQAARGGR